jgi:Raf kinase inhibitor-like YbhB/YbcL family protein
MRSGILILVAVVITMISSAFSISNGLVITSTSFTENGLIPSKYTCEGEDINPSLHIGNIPAGTKSFALILHDPDAPMQGGFTHWVMWNIDVKDDIAENFKGAVQGMNSAKKTGYMGMCPPSGTHRYRFNIYALDTKLSLSTKTDKAALEKAMEGHILSGGLLTGLYKKVK